MTALRVELFGGFHLLSNGEPIRPPASRVARSLLAYLLLNRGRSHERSRIVGIFWAEEAETDGRRKLSQNLWRIRQALDPIGYAGLIESDGDGISIADGLDVDVDVVEFVAGTTASLDAGSEASVRSLLSAVELYRGELLHGFYEDWVVEEQRRTAELYHQALSRLVQALKAIGANDEALIYARKLTWQEPLREEAHREVMRLCVLLGRPMEALRQYELLENDLYRDLGVEPEPATTSLFETIAARRDAEAPPVANEPVPRHPGGGPFVGRQAERTRGVDIIEQTIAGHGSVVLLEGDPGSGKTRLLDEITNAATWRGVEVLRGTASSGTAVPFGVIRSALGTGMTALRAEQLVEQVDPLWLTEVTRVVPQLAEWLPELQPAAPLESTEGRDRMIEAITIVMAAFGRITPHVIIFDDLHWADSDSIDVVRHLSSSTAMRRTSIFVAFRGAEGRAREDVWQTLRELDRAGGTVITLEPLAEREVEQLVRWAAGEDRTITAAAPRIMLDTGGNPLFVIETARALVESGGLVPHESLPMTDGVRGVIAERLLRLSTDERELLGAMAVRASPASSHQLFQWCAVGKTELLRCLGALINRRLVVESDSGYGFAHDQLRRVAYDLTLPEDRSRFHRVIAETLELDEWVEPAVLAHHLFKAGQRSRAFRYWLKAARDAASVHAYGTAAEFYESGLSSLDSDGHAADRVATLAEYEGVLATLGRRERQSEILDEWAVAVHDDPAASIEAQIRRSVFCSHGDDYAAAIELGEGAVRQAARRGLSQHRALLAVGRALHWSGDIERAVHVLSSAAEQAPGDPEIAIALGGAFGEAQRYRDARSQLSRALDRCRIEGDTRGEADALGLLALTSVELGDGAVVQDAFDQAIEACRSIGFTGGQAKNQVNGGLSQFTLGHIAPALDLFMAGRRAYQNIGNGRGAAIAALNEAMVRHLVLGDDDEARSLLTDSHDFFECAGQRGNVAHSLELLGSIDHRAGDTYRALERLQDALASASEWASRRRRSYVLATRASVLAEIGDYESAMADVEHARVDASSDLAIRLDVTEAWILACLDNPRAYDLAQRAMRSRLSGVSMAWKIPYYCGLVAERFGRAAETEEAFVDAHELLTAALTGLDHSVRQQAL
ncbi:MAG: AAA family ATPase, partial [Acidimicrobiia bacterium]|nr:AAA family ATPase [Acidimicrobiia bacterium]